jgi:Asp/Glu/hydantoin racemase
LHFLIRSIDFVVNEEGPFLPVKLALIHTSPTLTPLFGELCAKWLPEANIFHMVDESLIRNTVEAGGLQKVTTRRLVGMVESAGLAGADAVLVTCSSIGEAVTTAQQLFDFPVLRVDEAMAEAAIAHGRKIGVLATLKTTLEPTAALVRRKGAGKNIEIVDHLCDGAFAAVMAGDTKTHDAIVSKALLNEMSGVDVVVLAQASMARVLNTMEPGSLAMPVLSSPELGVQRMAEVLRERA